MTIEETFIIEIKSKIKSNPNHYPIIDKWNHKIWKQYEFKLFQILCKEIEERQKECLKNYYDNFVDIKNI